MNWNTRPESGSLSMNVNVTMFYYLSDGEPIPYPKAGDSLTIEYPSNDRAKGVIKNVSGEQIEVEINNRLSTWKLVDTNSNNDKITLNYVVC